MTSPLNLPPLPTNYWEIHSAPLMSEVGSLLKDEPTLIYEVAILIQQTLHTLAMGVFATMMAITSERQSAWKDFIVSVELTKAALLFLGHFKLLSFCMVIEKTPPHKVHSKTLLEKYIPLLGELAKDQQTTADPKSLLSIEQALKKHQDWLETNEDLLLKFVDNKVHFFHKRGGYYWNYCIPGQNILTSSSLSTNQVHSAKIIESHVNPPDPGLSTADRFDHAPEDVLSILELAKKIEKENSSTPFLDILDFIESYAITWNERLHANASPSQQVYFNQTLCGHEIAFVKLFAHFHLPFWTILLKYLVNASEDQYTHFAQAHPDLFLRIEEEFLPRSDVFSPTDRHRLLTMHAEFHMQKIVASADEITLTTVESHLMQLRRIALEYDFAKLFAHIDLHLNDINELRLAPLILADLVKRRNERMGRLNQALKQPIELK